MTKRAVVYARVSGDDRSNEGRNLESQLEMGREYAHEQGYDIVAELKEDEKGASGADIHLPQLTKLRDMAGTGQFDVLIVRELDRLSRDLAKQLIVEKELENNGVGIEYVIGEYPDTPEGRLNKHLKASIAEYEREKIRERMLRGRREAVKNGKVLLHGAPPYGYRKTEDGQLRIHEPEAKIIRMIFRWYAKGDEKGNRLSSRDIAERLTGMEVPTWADIHRKASKKRGRGEWDYNTVLLYLRKELYKGVWYYGKRGHAKEEWIPVDVPAIVSEDLWEAARSQRTTNTTEKKGNVKYEYLMRGRLRCSCGYSMIARSLQQGKYLYYGCTARNRGHGLEHCDSPYFPARDVDSTCWDWVTALLTNPKAMIDSIRQQQNEREKAVQPLREQLGVTEELIREKEKKLERLLDLYLDEVFERGVFREKQSQIENTIDQLKEAKESLEKQVADRTISEDQIESLEEFGAALREGLLEAAEDFEGQRRMIELLDVRGTLSVEDEKKVIYLESEILGEDVFVGIAQEHKFSKAVWPPKASQA
jgi:site-specific DNA recombinase